MTRFDVYVVKPFWLRLSWVIIPIISALILTTTPAFFGPKSPLVGLCAFP